MRSPLFRFLARVFQHRHPMVVVSVETTLILVSLLLSWLLRFDFRLPYVSILLLSAPFLVVIRLGSLASFQLLRGWWRYTGVSDVFDIMKAVLVGTAAFFVVIRLIMGVTQFPRSIFILEALLTMGFLAGARLISRAAADPASHVSNSTKRVAIIGAGFASEMILREMRHYSLGCSVVGCFDDDPSKLGLRLLGVPVLGAVSRMPEILDSLPLDEIFIAIPSATAAQMQRFVDICSECGVKYRTVPALHELIAGQTAFAQLREVNLDDLLGRQPVVIDMQSVRHQISGQTVMVTGAAGSIGSELCRQIWDFAPRKLVCVDQDETGIFYLQKDLRKIAGNSETVFCVADVGDRDDMSAILKKHRPGLIYHAAARKHVSIMQTNVREAVKNNIFALLNLMDVADACGCRAFLLISSDKAVHPTNVMGVTKRVDELIVSCRPSQGMRCLSVRFGNVLGSRGSVVPILQGSLRRNEELTISHADVTRYFMTSHEAVSLVLQAVAIGRQGDILVLDMNRPVRILDLARSLILLSGKSPEHVKIRFTGLGPGEKLSEELFYEDETVEQTSCAKIRRVPGKFTNWALLQSQLGDLRSSLSAQDDAAIRAQLKAIVPEYTCETAPPSRESATENTQPAKALARAGGRS